MLKNILNPRVAIYMASLAASILLFGITGCATLSEIDHTGITEVELTAVRNCQYVEMVRGYSGWGGLFPALGIERAKYDARVAAARLNATHVSWLATMGGNLSDVVGLAYRCPPETALRAGDTNQAALLANRKD